ncbi:MAG: hypothetical protein HOE48_00125 [Candidatus Latescibacteria bacterium]|nr:hypothetical protein [Candidatus Latescibacterota bacterium]MBT4136283.1 hypothetical protein [Candidatus Latescibacterota bacterium]
MIIRVFILGFFLVTAWTRACAVDGQLFELRREYNLVSAGIDSLVRAMHQIDDEVLLKPTLPEGRSERIVPDGMDLVMIFWGDDEARVWLNDFVVGETRLTPVEVVVPDLYLKNQNEIRARCWDTDWVESGFMCGLYLRDGNGVLYPVVVSGERWMSAGEPAMVITYAHPSPDIPGAEPIWGTRVFGVLELTVTFDQAAVQNAVVLAADKAAPPQVQKREMNYHDFVKQLSVLQARRENLLKEMQTSVTSVMSIPGYQGQGGRTAGLTLGKAGPLKEAMSEPISEKVRAWSQELPAQQTALIYPDKRLLKGEVAANLTDGGLVVASGDEGDRQKNYKPPEERGASKEKGKSDTQKGVSATSSLEGEGGMGAAGGGLLGRASRLGLLIPTVILGLYVLYVVLNWNSFVGRDARLSGEN